MNAMKGTQSIAFSESPYLVSAGSPEKKKEKDHLENILILHRRMTFSERKPGSLQKEQCRSLRVSWH